MTQPAPTVLLADVAPIQGPVLLVALLVLAFVVGVTIGGVVLGCVWAFRAGRGSRRALAGFVAIAAVEVLLTASAVLNDGGGSGAVVGAVLVVQAGCYLIGRARSEPDAGART